MKKSNFIIISLATVLFPIKIMEQLRRHARLFEKKTGENRLVYGKENIISYWNENWWFVLGLVLFIIIGLILYLIMKSKKSR